MNRLDANNATFQHDNAAINTSKLTKDCFKTKNIEALDWPTKSLFKPNRKFVVNFVKKSMQK